MAVPDTRSGEDLPLYCDSRTAGAMPVDCCERPLHRNAACIGWSSSPAARPFDRDCLPATAHRREREARKHTLAVNYHSMTSTSGSNRMSYSRHSRGLKQPFWTSLRQFDTDDPPHDTHKVVQFNHITREPEVGVLTALLHTERRFEWST
jgi:hypothetical protein